MTPSIISESLREGGIVSENSPSTLISNVMISILKFTRGESQSISSGPGKIDCKYADLEKNISVTYHLYFLRYSTDNLKLLVNLLAHWRKND
jgi:hypothetical protein